MSQVKDLPARSWASVREKWMEHIPPELEVISDQLKIQHLLEVGGVDLTDKGVIELVPSLREAIFSSATFLYSKSQYCIAAAKEMNERGFPTWSSLLMYDASFFGAKSICYLLGIADADRDKGFYLDAFFDETKKKKLVDVGHQAFDLRSRMTHEMLWKIFPRLMYTIRVDDPFLEPVRFFKKYDYEKFSRERNRLFYTCLGWSRENDILQSDLRARVVYDQNVQFFADPSIGSSEYFHDYNHFGLALYTFAKALLSDLGNQVPSVSAWIESQETVPTLGAFSDNPN